MFFFQAEDGIRDADVTGVQTCALPICAEAGEPGRAPFEGVEARPSARAPLLEVERLAKRFGGLEALRGVDLAVGRREIVGVLGPNGAGKSTLFDCVTGFQVPSGGRILLHAEGGDRVLTARPRHWIAQQGLARTFQLIRVFPSLTVWEHLLVGQEHRGESLLATFRPSAPETHERARELIRLVGLEALRDTPAGSLS